MQANTQIAKLMIMAGGTGGHIYPGIAVASYLREQQWQVHWLGSAGGMETIIVPKQEIPLSVISIGGVRGKSVITKLLAPLKIMQAVWQAMKVLRKERPDVVLGMGGFASGPGGLAAWLLGIPVCIHEQNAIAGMTNKLLAKLATQVLQAFPNTLASATATTGNPVRDSIAKLATPDERFKQRQGALRLLIVGGSRGAKVLNETVPETIALLTDQLAVSVTHQSGAGNALQVSEQYRRLNLLTNTSTSIEVREFIDDMEQAYCEADLIICRAGALTVSELAVAGLGAIFVPYPFAVDDHQTKNAQFLVSQQAAKVIDESELTATKLAETILQIGTREQCQKMANKAQQAAKPQATAEVAKACQLVVEQQLRKAA